MTAVKVRRLAKTTPRIRFVSNWINFEPPLTQLSVQPRSDTIDLNMDQSLAVDISDALSEKDKVKFTVHTKVNRINKSCVVC